MAAGGGVDGDLGWNYWDALPVLGFEACWVQLPDLAFGDIQAASE